MRVVKTMSKNARAFRMAIGAFLGQLGFLSGGIKQAHPETGREGPERSGRVRGVGAGRSFSCTLRDYRLQDAAGDEQDRLASPLPYAVHLPS